MTGMILAAGLGTRLRPITNDRPKAMVEVGGRPMIDHVARRLVEAGVDRLVINLHHFPDSIRRYVDQADGFGVEVVYSLEEDHPLETGGALLHAREFLPDSEPFIVHNVDILTDLDLALLIRAHSDALATLVVRPLSTTRFIVLDEDSRFLGYGNSETGTSYLATEPRGSVSQVDYCGIQMVSPKLIDLMTEQGAFGIMDVFFRLTRAGERVGAVACPPDTRWQDIGTHENLAEANRLFASRG
jgi:NDP-sugar pyrophosphorylase family protein